MTHYFTTHPDEDGEHNFLPATITGCEPVVTTAQKSVFQYFSEVMFIEPQDQDLKELPVDSVCGADCVEAIDAARGLLDHVETAFGKIDFNLWTDTVRICERVIGCYFHG